MGTFSGLLFKIHMERKHAIERATRELLARNENREYEVREKIDTRGAKDFIELELWQRVDGITIELEGMLRTKQKDVPNE